MPSHYTFGWWETFQNGFLQKEAKIKPPIPMEQSWFETVHKFQFALLFFNSLFFKVTKSKKL